jgi:hypothetical protein
MGNLTEVAKETGSERSTMEDKDLFKLFLSVAEHPGQNTEDTRKVFSVLVQSTLRYRDHMLKANGTVVTVEDVRIVLEWLVPALSTGRLPATDNKLRLDLLKIWLDDLKPFK